MTDLSKFDPGAPGNPNYNVFGLPFDEDNARVVILPVPWEVTAYSGAGTARSGESIFRASMQVDLYDAALPGGWRQGIAMRAVDKKMLMKSTYLHKESELFTDYVSKGDAVEKNKFMCKSLKDIEEGIRWMNEWVYDQTRELLAAGKLVVVLGGDHSVSLGYFKAQAEKHGDFGILHIDAHLDLRKTYAGFTYSHASVMYNALSEIPQVQQIINIGARDYSEEEMEFVTGNPRIRAFMDKDIKERLYEGDTWKAITDDIVAALPDKVHVSFDIDGLDPKLCPHTGSPVHGGFEVEQVAYLLGKIMESKRAIIGFDLVEVGVGESGCDANVGARVLYKLCNVLLKSNPA